MKTIEFQRIYTDLIQGKTSYLKVPIDDGSVTRAFVPEDRLILLGGGHVSLAAAQMAKLLDFSITVVDDRPTFANTERFSMVDEVICDRFADAIDLLNIRENDYVCVLTRGHQWDCVCVEKILSGDTMPYYFGMIGSRRRVEGMRENLLIDGYDAERIDQLHAPIGLKIGGFTPAEIALSICAEMVMYRHQKPQTVGSVMEQTNSDMKMLEYLANASEPRAMLLVLSSDGSTPVKSGAMMAVNALGQGFGTVGGGCSEAAAISKARRIIGTGERKILDIDMSDEVAAENGMVCGGSMRLLIEDITE